MGTRARKLLISTASYFLLAVLCAAIALAQGGLKTIEPPQGGRIVYGVVDGQTTEAGAMGAILKSIHASLGDKPQVGQLFKVRGTESTAVFFNVKRRSGDGGQVSGLIIATRTGPNSVEAALVSDDAARFSKSLSPLTKTLFNAWHPASVGAAASSADSAPPAQLKQIVLQDQSASVGLPEGWQLSPQSAMGTIFANGPNGELANLGMMFLASDTNNPRVQQTMRMVQAGGLRNTVYANAFYYPYGGDLVRTFEAVVQNARQKAGLPPAHYNITSAAPMPNPRLRCAHFEGTADFADGKGTRELNALYCVSPPLPASGVWSSLISGVSVPEAVAAKERMTVGAILGSYRVNQSVVSSQAAAIAAPSIIETQRIGDMVTKRIDATHRLEDEHNHQIEKYWDNNDKHSQEFENYQLGMSVISDNENTAHGTFWNQDAEALVKANPDRFQYVSAPDYWKGIDY